VRSFYVEWGDWFVAASATLALGTWALLRRPYVPPPTPADAARPFGRD
jgi:hypothetical protein